MTGSDRSSFSILRMAPVHTGGAAVLEKLCFAEPWSQESLLMLTREGAVGFVAVRGKEVIGYGGMMTVLDEGQITNIAVRPDTRRLGVGSAIVAALLSYAREHGIVLVTLEVRPSNTGAVALYGAHGFVGCGTRKHFYRYPAEDALLMQWQRTET